VLAIYLFIIIVASVKEPVGLLRTDGKRPDGLTVVPWQAGKNAVWDVTVADTLAASYVASTSVTAGSAVELAATRKEDKYTELSTTHNFVPLASTRVSWRVGSSSDNCD
jgi:hypothetical protein